MAAAKEITKTTCQRAFSGGGCPMGKKRTPLGKAKFDLKQAEEVRKGKAN